MKKFEFQSLKSDELREKKILLVGDSLEDYYAINNVLNKFKHMNINNFETFISDYFLEKKINDNNISFRSIGDYVKKDDFLGVYKKAIGFAGNWFKCKNKKDQTKYKDISLGSILQREMTRYFMSVLMNIIIVKKVIDQEKPDMIIFCKKLNKIKKGLTIDGKSVSILKVFLFIGQSEKTTVLYYDIGKKLPSINLFKFQTDFLKLEQKRFSFFNKEFKLKLPAMIWKIILKLIICKKYLSCHWAVDERKTNILFSSESGINYIGWNLPEYLLKLKKYNLFVLGGVYSQKDIKLNEIIQINFACLLKKIINLTQFIGKVNEKYYPEKEKQIFYFQNVNISDLVKDQIDIISTNIFPQLISKIDYFLKILKKHSIQLVISSDDTTTVNKTLILAAKSLNISTLVVQHGIPGHYLGYFPFSADKIAVMGEFSKKWFMKNQVSENRITITGIPRFEERDKEKRKDFSKKGFILYAGETGNDLGYMSHWLTYKDNEKIFFNLTETMKIFKDERLIIKLRRGDKQYDFYQNFISENSYENMQILTNEDSNSLIQKCKILITPYSTMAVEGILQNKPIITLNYIFNMKMLISLYKDNLISSETIIPFLEYNAAIEVRNPELLAKSITILLDNNDKKTYLKKGEKEFIKEYCCYIEGTFAHERIDKLINKMLIP